MSNWNFSLEQVLLSIFYGKLSLSIPFWFCLANSPLALSHWLLFSANQSTRLIFRTYIQIKIAKIRCILSPFAYFESVSMQSDIKMCLCFRFPATYTAWVRPTTRRWRRSDALWCRRSGARIKQSTCRTNCRATSTWRRWSRSAGCTRSPTSCRSCLRRTSPRTPRWWPRTRRGTARRRSSSRAVSRRALARSPHISWRPAATSGADRTRTRATTPRATCPVTTRRCRCFSPTGQFRNFLV